MTDDELKGLFDAMREDIGAIRGQRSRSVRTNAAIHADNAAAQVEARRHFEVLTEAMRSEIRLVESVLMVNEKLAA